MSPDRFIYSTYRKLQSMQDEPPTQMHRRAATGLRLRPVIHTFGKTVALRLDGQYTDRAKRRFATHEEAAQFAGQCSDILLRLGPPIPAPEPFIDDPL